MCVAARRRALPARSSLFAKIPGGGARGTQRADVRRVRQRRRFGLVPGRDLEHRAVRRGAVEWVESDPLYARPASRRSARTGSRSTMPDRACSSPTPATTRSPGRRRTRPARRLVAIESPVAVVKRVDDPFALRMEEIALRPQRANPTARRVSQCLTRSASSLEVELHRSKRPNRRAHDGTTDDKNTDRGPRRRRSTPKEPPCVTPARHDSPRRLDGAGESPPAGPAAPPAGPRRRRRVPQDPTRRHGQTTT